MNFLCHNQGFIRSIEHESLKYHHIPLKKITISKMIMPIIIKGFLLMIGSAFTSLVIFLCIIKESEKKKRHT